MKRLETDSSVYSKVIKINFYLKLCSRILLKTKKNFSLDVFRGDIVLSSKKNG